MALTSEWRSRPVFISSTFRDMHAERDYLAPHRLVAVSFGVQSRVLSTFARA